MSQNSSNNRPSQSSKPVQPRSNTNTPPIQNTSDLQPNSQQPPRNSLNNKTTIIAIFLIVVISGCLFLSKNINSVRNWPGMTTNSDQYSEVNLDSELDTADLSNSDRTEQNLNQPSEREVGAASADSSLTIDQTSIIFKKENQIMIFENANGDPRVLFSGISPSLSSDQKKVCYLESIGDNMIRIYHLDTKQTETIPTQETRLRSVSWSLNDNYLLTDSGTSPVGAGGIYQYSTHEKIASFSSSNKQKWLTSDILVFDQPQTVDIPRPFGSGSGQGIAKVSTITGEIETLLKATNLKDYSLARVQENRIYYLETTVSQLEDWLDKDRQTISHWRMSPDGSNKMQIDKAATLESQISTALPPEYQRYELISKVDLHPHQHNWVLFELDDPESYSNNLICIMNLNDPTGSFKQIAQGTNSDW